jgi:hypothetical protein
MKANPIKKSDYKIISSASIKQFYQKPVKENINDTTIFYLILIVNRFSAWRIAIYRQRLIEEMQSIN